MSRLTRRTKNGTAYSAIADTLPKKDQEIDGSIQVLQAILDIFSKLADYEDKYESEEN